MGEKINGNFFTLNGLNTDECLVLSHIFRSDIRRRIVVALIKGYVFPQQIRKNTGLSYSTISKNLRFLENTGIIKCQNPASKRGRIFLLSDNMRGLETKIIEWNNFITRNR